MSRQKDLGKSVYTMEATFLMNQEKDLNKFNFEVFESSS